MEPKINVVIPTIGRKTLNNAIESCLKEDFGVIVVNDGIPINKNDFPLLNDINVKYYELGMNYGMMDGVIYYGQVALNVGHNLSETEFTAELGDDDEFAEGAGKIYRNALLKNPKIDIWIPVIMYADKNTACNTKSISPGNVSHPLYRTKIFAYIPMYNTKTQDNNLHDFFHIKHCYDAGYKIDWLGEVCIKIRPKLPRRHGRGEVDQLI